MNNFFNKILIPFAIIHIRIIQYRYKKITIENQDNQSNSNIQKLILLQSKEYYYERQFDSWGKFHPNFSYSNKGLKSHIKFMNWLFPQKDFREWGIIIWYNPKAVTYYHNKIYNLQNGVSPLYEVEIPKQIKKWKQESEKL